MRPTTMWLACVLVVSACDRSGSGPAGDVAPAPAAVEPVAPVTPAPIVTPAPPVVTPPVVTPPVVTPPVVAPPVEPAVVAATAPVVDETFAALVERLTAGLPETADPAAAAFVQLRGEAFSAAQQLFALAAKREVLPWKHPFNLACAAARGDDEAVARVALREAVRRDPVKAAAKARTDPDLAAVRGREWFEAVLRGEPAPVAEAAPAAPIAAVEPAAVEPAAVEPPRPAAPKIPMAGEFPRGVAKALGKPELALLKTRLAEVHRAKAKVRDTLVHTDAAGVQVGFAVYEVSRYDACLGATDDPAAKANKRACRAKFYGDEEKGESNDMLCNDLWVVRLATITPLELGEPEEITRSCTTKVQRLAAHDFDADGQAEVLLDAIGLSTVPAYRTAGEENYVRLFNIFRLDGTTQLSVAVEWDISDGSFGNGTAQRFGLRDDDGEGHPDLIVASRSFSLQNYLTPPEILWPTAEDDPEAALGEISTERWPYDAATDSWLAPPDEAP